jgi:hypothetical protein
MYCREDAASTAPPAHFSYSTRDQRVPVRVVDVAPVDGARAPGWRRRAHGWARPGGGSARWSLRSPPGRTPTSRFPAAWPSGTISVFATCSTAIPNCAATTHGSSDSWLGRPATSTRTAQGSQRFCAGSSNRPGSPTPSSRASRTSIARDRPRRRIATERRSIKSSRRSRRTAASPATVLRRPGARARRPPAQRSQKRRTRPPRRS